MTNPLRIGTRGSALALWQARHVAELLRPLAGARGVELVEVQTTGDKDRSRPLSQLGGIGLFTKEVQQAVLDGRADVAVHSLKDLPTIPVAGLTLGAVPARGPVGDVFVSRRYGSLEALPAGAVVGTGSLRRRAQLLHRRPDLRTAELRGNVETRLRKLDAEGLDAIILAQAGLERLGLGGHVREVLDRGWMLPAVGQGALGLECRAEDGEVLELLGGLNDGPTRQAVLAERALLAGLGGGCLVPIGAHAEVSAGRLTLRAAVLSPDGVRRVGGEIAGEAGRCEELGKELAEEMLGRGAGEVLAAGR
jgi:hydroxymethylbilane synthase